MDWGGGNLEDLVYAAKYLQALDEVDDKRIGIWDGSFGGSMTYLALTKKTDIWKAGVAYVGFTDLHKLDASASKRYRSFYREHIGAPETHADLWYNRSPIHFAHQMTAHLRMMHGVNDPPARLSRPVFLEIVCWSWAKSRGRTLNMLNRRMKGMGHPMFSRKFAVTPS